MITKLSFKDYLESKKLLLQAIKESPIQTSIYDVTKYCKLVVGKKDDKEYIPLKPKQKIVIEWQYTDLEGQPEPVAIRFEDVSGIDPDEEYRTFWLGERLKKWLSKNAEEEEL